MIKQVEYISFRKDNKMFFLSKICSLIVQTKNNIGQYFLNTINSLVDKIEIYIAPLTHKKYGYKELGPTSEANNVDNYEDTLMWAISNKEIKNIAITAPYGAGKTSVLNTFFTKHPSLKYINISLAMFKDSNDKAINTIPQSAEATGLLNDVKNEDDTYNKDDISIKRIISDECEDELEEAILDQLLYHVKKDRIPLSRYNKVTAKFSIKKFIALCVLGYSICFGFYFYKPDIIEDYFKFKMEWFNGFKIYSKVGICISLILCIVMFYVIFNKVLGFISEIEFGNGMVGKVVIDREKSLAPFKRNLDEIVYFFKNTKYRTIVFEDMDRFNNPRIFVKLRELNHLLNNYEGINKKIVFIYALRDDVFENKDRTKFFDFIIPVIPYISTLNGYACLVQRFKQIEGERIKDFDELFLTVKPFLDDMRVLNNIGNEYSLYKSTIKNDDSPQAKREILALVIVKNLYPTVFAKIQKDGGVLKELIDDVNKKLEEEKSKINDEIEKKQKQIQKAKELSPINREVLKNNIIYLLEKKVGNHLVTEIDFDNNGFKTIDELFKDDNLFEKLLDEKTINVHFKIPYGYSYRTDVITISNFNEMKIGEKSFKEYWSEVGYVEKSKIASINKEIEDCNNKIEALKGDPFEIYNIVLGEEQIKKINEKYPVLVSLIENKYIDRSYQNYINYFVEGELTTEENDYIKSIRSKNELENWHIHLTDSEKIMKELIPSDYTHKEILNFDFLTFLLSAQDVDDKLRALFKLIRSNDELEFIYEYMNEAIEDSQHQFIKYYLDQYPGFWDDVIKSNMQDTDKIELFKSIIRFANIDTIENSDVIASEFGNDLDSLLRDNRISINEMNDIAADRLIEVFEKTDVRIKELGIIEDEELAYQICENNLFEVNYQNLRWYIKTHFRELDNTHLGNKIKSVISSVDEISIKNYLLQNVVYWGDILSNVENKDETIETIATYLNKIVGTKSYKKESIESIIANQNAETGSISELFIGVDFENETYKEQWKQIVDAFIYYEKLTKNWLNVQVYISIFESDNTIVDFINKNIDELEKTEPAENVLYDDIVEQNLTEKAITVILNNHIDALVELAKEAPYTTYNKRVTAEFIRKKIFDFDEDLYGEIMDDYELRIEYIKAYWDNIDAILDYKEFEEEDYTVIVESNLSVEQKNYCLEKFEGSNISNEVYAYLKDKHVENDNLIRAIWKKTPVEDKLKTLIKYFEVLYINIEKCLTDMGGEYLGLIQKENQHNAKINNNKLNGRLMYLLREKKYITNFWPDKKNDSILVVRVQKTI